MRILTLEQELNFCKLHTEDKISANKLAKLYPDMGGDTFFRNLLIRHGVYTRGTRGQPLLLDGRAEECASLYMQLKCYEKVSKELNVSAKAVINCIKKYYPELSLNKRNSYWDVNYFENIDSSMKSYFLGWICSDGCITNSSVNLILHSKDISVLNKFKEELRHTAPLTSRQCVGAVTGKPFSMSALRLGSTKMVSDLEKIGIYSRKSASLGNLITIIPEDFVGSYVTGLFDGDGCIHVIRRYKEPSIRVSFIGTLECIEGIRNWLGFEGEAIRKAESSPVYRWKFSKKQDVLTFFQKTYFQAPFKLERKYNKFLEAKFIRDFINDSTSTVNNE